MKRRNVWLALCSCTLLFGGCSDDSSQADSGSKLDTLVAADLGGDSGTDTIAAVDTKPDHAASRSFNGKVIDGTLAVETPVSGAKVCLLPGKTVCATATSSGLFLINVPAAGEVALSVEASGYGSLVYLVKAQDFSLLATYIVPLSTTSSTSAYFTAVGVTLDKAKGIVSLGAYESPAYGAKGVSGVSVSISPAPSGAMIYTDASGMPDKTLTSTSSTGFGAVANVVPGDYQATFSHATKSCALEMGDGWPGTTASSAKLKVMAEHSTWIAVVCK